MEKPQAISGNKRQHDEGDSDSLRKHHRLESCDEQSGRIATITDLDDVCLENIFNHLNLKDLFSVADANKFLVPAARHVYKRKFGTKTVRISGCDDLQPNTRANARNGYVSRSAAPRDRIPGTINIRNLKWTLSFLRHFGPSIAHLSISYNRSRSHRYQYVHQYINKYCVESLVDMSFHDKPNIKIQHFHERPFVNVVSVNFSDCHLGTQLPSMVEWFPNLQSLKLSKVRLNHRYANASFHHLENLEIFETNYSGFSMRDVSTFLPLNRGLRNVNFNMCNMQKLPIAALLDIIRENQSIEKLVVRMISESIFQEILFFDINPIQINLIEINPIEIDRFVNEHPSLVELDLLFCRFKAVDAIALHRQLKCLKKLNFRMTDSEYAKL